MDLVKVDGKKSFSGDNSVFTVFRPFGGGGATQGDWGIDRGHYGSPHIGKMCGFVYYIAHITSYRQIYHLISVMIFCIPYITSQCITLYSSSVLA